MCEREEYCRGCLCLLLEGDAEGSNCRKCVAEEAHDFDVEPGAEFDRYGARVDIDVPDEKDRKLNVSNYLHVVWDNDQALLDLITRTKLFHVTDVRGGVQLPEGVPTLEVFDDDFVVSSESNWDQIWDILPDLIELRCGELAGEIASSKRKLADQFDVSASETKRLMARAIEAVHIMEAVDYLREPEGACVTIACDNTDFGIEDSPNNIISVTDDGTGWTAKEFGGDCLLKALQEAVACRKLAKEVCG